MRHSNLKYDKLSDVLLFVAEFFRFLSFYSVPNFCLNCAFLYQLYRRKNPQPLYYELITTTAVAA